MSEASVQIPWREDIAFLTVECLLGEIIEDRDDEDLNPDLVATSGTVTISCDTTNGMVRLLLPGGRAMMATLPNQVFDVVASTGELRDRNGNVGVRLVNPESPGVDPQGFTYTATVKPLGAPPWMVTFGAAQSVGG